MGFRFESEAAYMMTPTEVREKIEMLFSQAESLRSHMVATEFPYDQDTVDNYHMLLKEAKMWIQYLRVILR